MTSRRAFGDALRRHREQRGITLETISEQTKISASLLAALERGDCSRWPAGIYSRAYIRDYAHAIGLDRDEVAAQFSECFSETAFPDGAPQRKDEPSPATPPSTPLRLTLGAEPGHSRRTLRRRAGAVALDLVLTTTLAALVSVASTVPFWTALAVLSLCWHALIVVGGSGDRWDAALRPFARRAPRKTEPAASDGSLAEAA